MFETTPSGLLELIKRGESETAEFKAFLPPDNVVARDLIAFANTQGGILIVGVDDQGQVLGLPDAEVERTIERLKRISTSLCEWSTRTGTADLQGRKVVFLVVTPAPSHLAPVMTSAGDVYARQGVRDVRLTESQCLDLVRKHRPKEQQPQVDNPGNRPCIVFVAMSFREEQEPALVDYFSAMKRAVERTTLPIQLKRVDLMEGDFEISQQLMDAIRQADIVLTDFTLNSANVYFELGYARGCNKRVIQTARKYTALEFDVRNWRTIVYRNATELEEKLALELKAAHAEVMTSSDAASPDPPVRADR
jgi:hypothetical protein